VPLKIIGSRIAIGIQYTLNTDQKPKEVYLPTSISRFQKQNKAIERYSPQTVLLLALESHNSTANALAEEIQSSAAYSYIYDISELPTEDLPCPNSVAGLAPTLGFDHVSQVPGYPPFGAIEKVKSWESLSCGECYRVTNKQGRQTINIIAVDHGDAGLVLSLAALDKLTGEGKGAWQAVC